MKPGFGPVRAIRISVALWMAMASMVAYGADRLDTFEQRMRPCAACHGEQGRATRDGYFPRIAGKPAGYLFEQLMNFGQGYRHHAQMSYLVDRQSPAYLQHMADYFAGLELPYPAPQASRADAQALQRGQDLIRKGDAARDLPACQACHGEALTGLQPAVPGLLGLPYDYLVAQIGAWREGVRRARAPDCMAQIAQRLQPADIQAVAAWLAAQPVPQPARAPSGTVATTLRCGSLEPRR